MSVALVTGATGLLGSHIVERLLDSGWSVRALARAPDEARALLGPQVDVMRGDVLDEASFVRAAAGCDVIFHTAAHIITRGGWEPFRVTNIEGTKLAIIAAERAKARLLQISSIAAYGLAARYDALQRGERTTEDAPLSPLHEREHYARSKRESEELVLRAHSQGRVWGTAVRPAIIYGRRDRQFVPRLSLLMKRGAVPLLNGGRANLAIVHAVNVADGAVLAATTDVAGGRVYNLANDYDVSVRRFFELAGEGLGQRAVLIPMPFWAARGLLRVAKLADRTLSGGRFNMVSSSALHFLALDNPFSSDRARRELRWSPSVRPESGVPDAFRWWKSAKADA